MIDTDDQRDYAEEAAVRAEARREAEAEAAHEEQRAELIDRLRALADEQQQQATRRLATIAESVAVRAHIGADMWAHTRRHATVAHLAGRAAATVERYNGYNLRGQVVALLSAEVNHKPDGVTLNAADRVRDVLTAVLAEQWQRGQDIREQADLDETRRSLR